MLLVPQLNYVKLIVVTVAISCNLNPNFVLIFHTYPFFKSAFLFFTLSIPYHRLFYCSEIFRLITSWHPIFLFPRRRYFLHSILVSIIYSYSVKFLNYSIFLFLLYFFYFLAFSVIYLVVTYLLVILWCIWLYFV